MCSLLPPPPLPFVAFQQVAESAQLRKRFGSFDVGRCIEHSYLSMTAVNDVGEVVAFAAFQVRARERVCVLEREVKRVRERGGESVCVRERGGESVCACVSLNKRERKRAVERQRERVCVYICVAVVCMKLAVVVVVFGRRCGITVLR